MKKTPFVLLALTFAFSNCKKETSCTFIYSSWSSCANTIQTRTYSSIPLSCTPPKDSIQRSCSLFINDLPVTDIEGNIYNTVKLGSQTWTTKNLNVSKYCNGDEIPQVTSIIQWRNLATGAWCYYQNNSANGLIYGKLYNWYAVNDSRGLAPKGYHIPTKVDLDNLTTYLGETAGGTMKESGTIHWNSPNIGATNSSGFTGLPGGKLIGGFDYLGSHGFWWTSSEIWDWSAYQYFLESSNNMLNQSSNYIEKTSGFSVRCIKD